MRCTEFSKLVGHKAKAPYYKCLTCLESFGNLREVKCHQHQITCKYFCERCCLQLDTKLAIVIHVIEHDMDDEPKYKCKKCFLEFHELNEYEHHKRSSHRRKVVSHQSSDSSCESDIQNIYLNVASFNVSKRQKKCKLRHHRIAESDFNRTKSIFSTKGEESVKQNIHTTYQKDHHNINDVWQNCSKKDKYYCKFCSKSFISRSEFNEHLKTNIEYYHFGCYECGKFFSLKSSLLSHMDIHGNRKYYGWNRCQKSFICKYCDKGFTQKSQLERHISTHSGKKPFECQYCNKSFNYKSHLNCHIRIHTGEKPFECKYCCKCFKQMCDLNKHIRIHTGERPFKCIHCDKCFTQMSTLKRHVKTHTGYKLNKC